MLRHPRLNVLLTLSLLTAITVTIISITAATAPGNDPRFMQRKES